MSTASLLAPIRRHVFRPGPVPTVPGALSGAELADEIRRLEARGLRGRGARLAALLDEAGERDALAADLDHYESSVLAGGFPVGGRHDDPVYFGACRFLAREPRARMAPAVLQAGVPSFRSAFAAAVALWHSVQLRGTGAR